ncbi:unnamed protein product [Peronospora belbahrii]|uniref:Extracellular membrane protein CFEM domain-containing protein n=1 Tax=Peronospora belbahrii TaxID=622444 RepID=A0ABN8D8Y9_9STRA|nr:unnamed protein product [Peronospora belbahrii]
MDVCRTMCLNFDRQCDQQLCCTSHKDECDDLCGENDAKGEEDDESDYALVSDGVCGLNCREAIGKAMTFGSRVDEQRRPIARPHGKSKMCVIACLGVEKEMATQAPDPTAEIAVKGDDNDDVSIETA